MSPADAIALPYTALILAGGRGSRMGGVDKGLQNYAGLPLALAALARLQAQTLPPAEILINANRNLAAYESFGVPVWPDALADYPGPLAGMLAGLAGIEGTGSEWLVTVPCDTPRFPVDLVARLLVAARAAGVRAAMPVTANAEVTGGDAGAPLPQPVFCLLHRSLRPALEAALAAGERKIERFTRAQSLAARIGVPLETFEGFEPWFVAEAISQLQLMQLGFAPSAGVESFFLERAHADGKTTQGLETAHDQIELFEAMPLERQAQYLLASLEESGTLPAQVDAMVAAWRAGDSGWFANQMQSEFGRDPRLYQSLLAERNRKWVPKIEALLREDRNYLVIVGTGHLAGRDSVVELLRRDGFNLTQQ